MLRKFLLCTISTTSILFGSDAFAVCRVSNQTRYSFTIESGNTSNQRVGAHTTTSIAAGKILARSDDGKTVGGFCKDGDAMRIEEDKGVLVLRPGK